MKEIKFRAFQKSTQKMLLTISMKEICTEYERLTEEEYDDLIIMQSTGLFDKNGKEIFEGDVVEYLDAGGFANEDVGINTGMVELDFREGINFTNRGSVEMEDVDFDSDVEIIGNIYENPELLNS